MHYVSTRGHSGRKQFSETLLEGLAEDGGLYIPQTYPRVDDATLDAWRTLSYPSLAFEVLSLYISDIPPADLKAICERTYTPEVFGSSKIAPLRKLENGLYLQGLSNGPTLAFKDMAMQLLGNLLEYELARRQENLNILGATSGDTGSAAEYAMRGKKGVRVFMLSPRGRMSAFQQAQMFSLQDRNIHNIAIDGVFDDCQDIVKQVTSDLEFKQQYKIGAVNSINWARLLAQVVYYFSGSAGVRTGGDRCKLCSAFGEFRKHLRGAYCAHDGASNIPAGPCDQRERRARRVLPHRGVSRPKSR
jgi:threonine synthase